MEPVFINLEDLPYLQISHVCIVPNGDVYVIFSHEQKQMPLFLAVLKFDTGTRAGLWRTSMQLQLADDVFVSEDMRGRIKSYLTGILIPLIKERVI